MMEAFDDGATRVSGHLRRSFDEPRSELPETILISRQAVVNKYFVWSASHIQRKLAQQRERHRQAHHELLVAAPARVMRGWQQSRAKLEQMQPSTGTVTRRRRKKMKRVKKRYGASRHTVLVPTAWKMRKQRDVYRDWREHFLP